MAFAAFVHRHQVPQRAVVAATSWFSAKRGRVRAVAGVTAQLEPVFRNTRGGKRYLQVLEPMHPTQLVAGLAGIATTATAFSQDILSWVDARLAWVDSRLRLWATGCIQARLQEFRQSGQVPPGAFAVMQSFVNDVVALASGLRWQALFAAHMAMEVGLSSQRTLAADLRLYPEILNEPLEAPIVIVGLPRTGSTLLHHLLSLDPEAQCLRTFELMRPVRSLSQPFPRLQEQLDRWRSMAALVVMKHKNPDWEQHHAVSADAPEECILALSRDLPRDCMVAVEAVRHVGLAPQKQPDKTPWLSPPSGEQARAAYRNYRTFLQHEQLRKGTAGKRYVLKGQQIHLRHLRCLQEELPGARIVWTHRPAKDIVSSLCGMRETQHKACVNAAPDREHIGRHVLATLAEAFSAGKTALDGKGGEGSDPYEAVHVHYDELVRDPIMVVERLYSAWGLVLSPEHRAAMEAYLVQSNLDRQKLHASKPAAKTDVASSSSKKPHFSSYGISDKDLQNSLVNRLSCAVFSCDGGVLSHKELSRRIE